VSVGPVAGSSWSVVEFGVVGGELRDDL